ncbi:PHP domain-containing protein [Pseudozobellia thermophila]|uniref:Polymerase/histidinol phosphatase N-terminal domain-containing protein n=1 Tax=Pseudozobellia thermophila TaxID=192903 RepID=A0A1M6B3U2_9FLAO|nr:PHP domain-containing protein [Pseudozobellia thermophila]SHI43422.1 hypothetical protein SAMN04488513_101277 [Pseudozobellia thermophila]
MRSSILKSLFLLALLALALSCAEKKGTKKNQKEPKWFKGNLHTHSYWSDGDEFPEVILDWYKANGYHFLALSDHNTMAAGEKWITLSDDSLLQKGFQTYLAKYGEDWVTHKVDSGKTLVKLKTFAEYQAHAQEEGKFLVIPSEEITDRYENKHIHMNATNIQAEIQPMGGGSVLEVMQNNLDQVLRQRESTGVAIIPHINHPNFHYSIGLDDMIALKGERFFEVYNGHPSVHNMGDSTHISTEKMWDLINIAYLEAGKPLMYGLATDDSHRYHRIGKRWSNAGRGWVMVKADTLSATSLIGALEAGDFYASTGLTLKAVEYSDNTLSVEVEPEAGIEYTIAFIGCKTGETETEVVKEVKGTKGTFKLSDDFLFVRSKVTSSKLQNNPIEDFVYEMALTQPVVPNTP